MISNTQLEDDAEYECQVLATQSSKAIKSKKAKLTVFGKLENLSSAPIIWWFYLCFKLCPCDGIHSLFTCVIAPDWIYMGLVWEN